MHISEVEAYQRQKDEKMRRGQDYRVESSDDKLRKGFAEHDGNYDNNTLGVRIKPGVSNDDMPSIKEAYNSSNPKSRSV